MATNESKILAIDNVDSTKWAICGMGSAGVGDGGGFSVFDFELVNLSTGRAHHLALYAGGFTLGPLPFSISTTTSYYSYFITPKPMDFMDFDSKGAVVADASALLYSVTRITIWDGGHAYVGQTLVNMLDIDGGWGFSTPGVDMQWGRTEVVFGDGVPSGDVALASAPNYKPSEEPVEIDVKSIVFTREKVEFELAGDALFDFNKADIKVKAVEALTYAGKVIKSKPGLVNVNGYTDSIGDDAYNRDLSQRRADAVAKWLIEGKYVKAANVSTYGGGSEDPQVDNKDRQDTPDNRKRQEKNRRVSVVIKKR